MSYHDLVLERDGAVATLTLNRPQKLNAITPALARELITAIAELRADESVRVVVLTGAGRAFCAGGDVQEYLLKLLELSIPEREELFRLMCQIVYDLVQLEKPTIAAVNGPAMGGGCNLALACDVRLAATTATFGLVFVKRGLSGADMGATYLLPRLVGLGKAYELLYGGEPVDAGEAARIGLVNQVVEGDDLLAAAQAQARRWGEGPPVAYRLTKRALNRYPMLELGAELDFETSLQSLCFATDDFREGIDSFREKRPASFRGR